MEKHITIRSFVFLYVGLALVALLPFTASAELDLTKKAIRFKILNNINDARLREPSGIVFHKKRGTLFSVGDEGDIMEFKTDGTPVKKSSLGKRDLEGITYDPATGFLYVAVEGEEKILEIHPQDFANLRTFSINREFKGKTVLAAGGEGIEAITFVPDRSHKEGGTFFVANQALALGNNRDASALLEVEAPLRTAISNKAEAKIVKYLPINVLDLAGLHYNATRKQLYVLSDMANSLLIVNMSGNIINRHRLGGKDQEGIAIDESGMIYIAQDSGEINKLEASERPDKPVTTITRQEPSKTVKAENSLTIDEATELAIAASDIIADLRAAVDIAEQSLIMVNDIADPELRVNYDSGSQDSLAVSTNGATARTSEDSSGYAVGVRFFPPNPWIRSKRVSAAKANHFAALADLRFAKWQVFIEANRLFAEINYLKKDLQHLQKLTAVYKDMRDVVKQSADQGQLTMQDVMTASRRYLSALSSKNSSRQLLKDAYQRLATLINLPVSQAEITQFEIVLPDMAKTNIEKLKRDVIRNRADISALSWRAIAAEAQYNEIQATELPWLQHVQLSYGAGEDEDSFRRRSSDSDEWEIAAAVNIPIFSRLGNAKNVMRSQYHAAQGREARAVERVSIECRDAIDTMQRIDEGLTEYKNETTPVIMEMQEVLENIENTPGLSPEEPARLREQILETERLRIKSEYDYNLAVIRLEELLGVRFVKMNR